MSKKELVDSYVSGAIGRRSFIRGLVGLGASASIAATFAVALRPATRVLGQAEYPEYPEEPDPLPDAQLTVSGDPRFPIQGSATLGGFPGLTYSLGSGSSQGSVVVSPNGQFTFVANSINSTTSTFTVVSTDETGDSGVITVTVILAIDKTVSTSGSVSAGGGGTRPSVDARTGAIQASDPDVDEDEDEDEDYDPRS